jgi:hypothetical protein
MSQVAARGTQKMKIFLELKGSVGLPGSRVRGSIVVVGGID